MAGSQISGFTSANILEVEANTKAARVTLRAEDYGALGNYSVGANSGIMAAGLAANSPIVSFRWADATNLCLIKKIQFSAAAGATAFAAGLANFKWFIARSFSAVDTGGSSFLPSTNFNKLRATMGTTLLNSLLASQTATLTAGTRTKDTNPFAATIAGVPAVIGQQLVPPGTLIYERKPGEFPLILVQNEGIILEATVPATGVWGFTMNIDWTEIASY
jgi:hypothetical protein